MFDQKHIQFKPKGAGVALCFSPEFMRKNQKANQVNDPWYIPAIPIAKSEFAYCPVRALRNYHGYLTEPPEGQTEGQTLSVWIIMPERSSVQPLCPDGSARLYSSLVPPYRTAGVFLDLLKLTRSER